MTVAVSYAGARRHRPPRAELRLDVRLDNDGDAAAWAILPDTLASPPRELGTQVWSLAAWRLGELRRVFVLHATGDAGWYAVLVPPHARVALAALPFAWWGTLPEEVDVQVELVSDLTVDGAPVAARLGAEPGSDDHATVDASRLADPTAVLAAVQGTPSEPLQIGWTPVLRASTRAPVGV